MPSFLALKYQDLSGGKRGHGWTSLEFEVQSFYVDTYCYILLRSDLSPVCQYVIATNKRGKRNIIGNGDKILAKFYIEVNLEGSKSNKNCSLWRREVHRCNFYEKKTKAAYRR